MTKKWTLILMGGIFLILLLMPMQKRRPVTDPNKNNTVLNEAYVKDNHAGIGTLREEYGIHEKEEGNQGLSMGGYQNGSKGLSLITETKEAKETEPEAKKEEIWITEEEMERLYREESKEQRQTTEETKPNDNWKDFYTPNGQDDQAVNGDQGETTIGDQTENAGSETVTEGIIQEAASK